MGQPNCWFLITLLCISHIPQNYYHSYPNDVIDIRVDGRIIFDTMGDQPGNPLRMLNILATRDNVKRLLGIWRPMPNVSGVILQLMMRLTRVDRWQTIALVLMWYTSGIKRVPVWRQCRTSFIRVYQCRLLVKILKLLSWGVLQEILMVLTTECQNRSAEQTTRFLCISHLWQGVPTPEAAHYNDVIVIKHREAPELYTLSEVPGEISPLSDRLLRSEKRQRLDGACAPFPTVSSAI